MLPCRTFARRRVRRSRLCLRRSYVRTYVNVKTGREVAFVATGGGRLVRRQAPGGGSGTGDRLSATKSLQDLPAFVAFHL